MYIIYTKDQKYAYELFLLFTNNCVCRTFAREGGGILDIN